MLASTEYPEGLASRAPVGFFANTKILKEHFAHP